MGESIVNLTEEKATITDQLHRVQELECQLGKAERRLAVERAAMDNLQAEVADKEKHLQAYQAQVDDLIAQIETPYKKLNLRKVQCAKIEARTFKAEEHAKKAEEEVAFLKQEMPKRRKVRLKSLRTLRRVRCLTLKLRSFANPCSWQSFN